MFKVIFPNLNYKFNEIDFNFLDDLNVHKEVSDELIDVLNVHKEMPNEPIEASNVHKDVHKEESDEPIEVQNVHKETPDEPIEASNVHKEVSDEPIETQGEPIEVKMDIKDVNILVSLIKKNKYITLDEMSIIINKSSKTVQRIIKTSNRIKRVGSSRYGYWKIIE